MFERKKGRTLVSVGDESQTSCFLPLEKNASEFETVGFKSSLLVVFLHTFFTFTNSFISTKECFRFVVVSSFRLVPGSILIGLD